MEAPSSISSTSLQLSESPCGDMVRLHDLTHLEELQLHYTGMKGPRISIRVGELKVGGECETFAPCLALGKCRDCREAGKQQA